MTVAMHIPNALYEAGVSDDANMNANEIYETAGYLEVDDEPIDTFSWPKKEKK
jgi:hypothetical protein